MPKGERGVKIQISPNEETARRLDELCQEKGVQRTALVSLLINERWKEEHMVEK